MHRLTAVFLKVCNLRTLVALAAVWVLARGPLPEVFEDAQEKLQAHLFRLGLHLSDLPLPQTHITVIHVPDIEYERWLVDLPGAASLDQIIKAGGPETVFGLVLEQPLVLIQPAAESMLEEIQQGRRTRDHLFREATALLERRESLVAALKSPQLVLGLTDQSSHFYRRIPVRESFTEYPQPLRDWLWPWPDPLAAKVVSPGLQYFPLDSAARQEKRLALVEGGKVIPMFPLQYWAVASRLSSGPEVGESLHWQRDSGFMLGIALIPTSSSADIVPLYGSMSGIRASMRQITLGAALAGGELSGWVLLGRDSSATLERAGQVIASLGDRAFLHEPAWWSAIHKVLLLVLAVFLVGVVPWLEMRWVSGVSLTGLATVATLQVLGQVVMDWWLPGGDIILFGGLGLLVMLLWRWQHLAWTFVEQRADQAQLALAESCIATGQLDIAWDHTRHCRSTAATLDCLSRIAECHEINGDYVQALAVLQDLRRRKRRYGEVSQRIKRLRACLAYKEQTHRETGTDSGQATVPAEMAAG